MNGEKVNRNLRIFSQGAGTMTGYAPTDSSVHAHENE